MRERSDSLSYSAMPQYEGQVNPEDSRKHSINPQQMLSDAQHTLVDYIQTRTHSVTENRKKWVLITMICGLSSISLGTLIYVIDPYQILFKMKMVFSDGGETFLMWKKPDVNLYLKVTLFNITNAQRYMDGLDSKMNLHEVGPYVYREFLEHANTTFNDNGTVSASPKHPLEFQPHLSGGKEDDMVFLPNIALLSISQVVADQSFLTRYPINLIILQTNSQPLVQMTAKEFMFGYKSKLLTLGNNFLPSWINFDKLGLIDRMYNIHGDTSTTFTGETGLSITGLLDNYNGQPVLPQWPYPCNNITGASDGTKFQGLLKGDEKISFFRKSLCRTVELVKVGEQSIGGLGGFKYEIVNNSFDNGQFNPDNKCYCRKGRCMPNGLLDVAECYYGFPIALSYPHFLDAEPNLVDAFSGIKPDRKNHSSYFIINDQAGIPLKVSVKLQINMALGDLSGVTNVKRFSHMYLPMLWMEIEMPQLTESLNSRFFIYLYVGPVTQEILIYVMMTCGVAFLLLSISSSVLIPRLTFDSARRFPPAEWVPQHVPHRRKPERSRRQSRETDDCYSSHINLDDPLQEYKLLPEKEDKNEAIHHIHSS